MFFVIGKMLEKTPVHTQLLSVMAKTQEARHCFLKIMGCMRYRARQGLAFREHEVCEVNLYHHVKFTATGDPHLSSWLSRSHDSISPQFQNDYLTLVTRLIPASGSVFNYKGWHSECAGERAGFHMFKICG